MTTHIAARQLHVAPRITCHDRVRVPDGRIGEITGFYRRTIESVLVSFSAGHSEEFALTDVEALDA